jgi:chaperonin cofactor prefoldin
MEVTDMPEVNQSQQRSLEILLLTFDIAKKIYHDCLNMDLQELCSENPDAVLKLKKLLAFYENVFSSGNIAVTSLIKKTEEVNHLKLRIERLEIQIERCVKQREFDTHK